MTLDPLPILAAAAGAIAVVACVFGITTLHRHDDQPNRLIAAALLAQFVGLMVAPAVGHVGLTSGSTDLARPAMAALLLGTVGAATSATLVWNGLQGLAGRTPLIDFSIIATLIAVGAAYAVAGTVPEWQVLPAAVIVALGSAFGAVELRDAPMSTNLNSIILEVVLWAQAVGVIIYAVLSGLDRMDRDDAWAAFGCTVAAGSIVTAMTMMALRVERYGNWWALGEAQDRAELGLHEAGAFAAEATDRLDRCRLANQPTHIIVTALPGLDELNLAYGHLAGDAALRWVAELLRRQAPSSAILGHLGAGRFALVTSRDPELVATSIQNGMMRVPPPPTLPVRLTPVFAWASTDEAAYDFDLLRQTAEERLSYVS